MFPEIGFVTLFLFTLNIYTLVSLKQMSLITCSPKPRAGLKIQCFYYVLLVYVPINSKKTMHHIRSWFTGKFNTPALY